MRLGDHDHAARLPDGLARQMSHHWVVFEHGLHWYAAIQSILRQRSHDDSAVTARCELASDQEDLLERLQRPMANFAALEVREDNLRSILRLLTVIRRDFRHARAVALIERDWPGSKSRLAKALAEAGAVDVALSPRAVRAAVDLGLRHSATTDQLGTPLVDLIWQSLPWQRHTHRYR